MSLIKVLRRRRAVRVLVIRPVLLGLNLRRAYEENGLRWTVYYAAGRRSLAIGASLMNRARRLEHDLGVPGLRSREANREMWEAWDWSRGGEEWTPSSEWKQALIDCVLLANLPRTSPVSLEIGPGAGRWSGTLLHASSRLVLVDISEHAIRLCQERFREATNVVYHVTTGSTISPIADSAIDFVWSFDVFIQLAPVDTRAYIREIARVIRPGGRAVIHHGAQGGAHGGGRSTMTGDLFSQFVRESGLRVYEQFDCWGADGMYRVPERGDVITVFGKPDA